MSNMVYLKIMGEQQGDISQGCGSEQSVGNRYQYGHEDEIYVFSLDDSVTNTSQGVKYHGINFCKTVDKSSPLLMNAINNNERCWMSFDFYRINRSGRWEKYFNIEVRGASLSVDITQICTSCIDQEYITVQFDYICYRHLAAGTEYCHLIAPERYNTLFPVAMKITEPEIKKREITLTIGVFFDGTGNNITNANLRMSDCNPESFGIDPGEAGEFNQRCMEKKGITGTGATSYLGGHTNIHWLNSLYVEDAEITDDQTAYQRQIYVEGIGTENNKADSLMGMGLGNYDTGVIAKTDRAVQLIREKLAIFAHSIPGQQVTIKALQFDVFGFSRGAAAARHFASRVFQRDPALVTAVSAAFSAVTYQGKPAGEVRFLGIFDTVAAVGGVEDGFNPHDSNNPGVRLALPRGIAKQVFHLTAMHECRYNFCLNSVKGHWPELSLPGAHSDIGGGYNATETEYLFLTRPEIETRPESVPDSETRVYRHAAVQAGRLLDYPVLAPLLPSGVMKTESDADDRMPQDRYGTAQKRVGAAVTFHRTVTNEWSKIPLRVMYEVARMAGVNFKDIQKSKKLLPPPDLQSLCDKAVQQAKATLKNDRVVPFSSEELRIIGRYIHCSANWNTVDYHLKNSITAAAAPAETFSYVNRPDEEWTRTVYNMDGAKQQ
ncbi:type VI secretion system tube protein TssD [Atlantibacter subterraneus]|uniref:type VI secretion system tube protein TssD n=1 Tax=Atlantibacter subterraneus TaxID=255519 RepID=UPI00289DFE79|nr:type VI secretion system tube protein TssD [Atlantibacter subterranea]